jgi:hypothetical protein
MENINQETHITRAMVKSFIAGAEFMQGEVKDLESQLEQQKIMNPISVDMVATISELSEKLSVAVEALEFYGNKENWQTPEDQGFEHHDSLSNDLADMIHEDDDKETGGKRAREALKKVGEM